MPSTQSSVTGNRLLALLPRKHRDGFVAECEQVDLVFGDVISEEGDRIEHVYFPTGNSFISLMTRVEGSPNLEVGMVGNEGMSGISVMLNNNVSPLRTLVQGSGTAIRMKTATFARALKNRPPLVRVLNRYLYVLMSQLAQTAACTRFHIVEGRLARWLLMTQDRAHADRFELTQEFVAKMLGVRRVGVTASAGGLQRLGLIKYRRGELHVLDRAGLEAVACSCYAADQLLFTRIMGARRAQLPSAV